MKKNVLKSIVLFGGILFLAASCVKEIESKNDTYRPAGSPIVFSAATGYDNGVATRTTYSGETVTLSGYSNPFERIDWVSGDKIKVCYFNGGAAAVYTVGSPTADGEKSTADISSQSSMAWAGGTDDHVFYAMYPDATSDSGHGTNSSASLEVSPNGAFVSGLIPAAQTVYQKATGSKVYDADMVYGYLVSKKTISANSAESAVELPFRPATTTFQFQFKTESGSAAVTSFEMTSATSNLAGNFSFNMLTGADADQRGSASWGEVTVTNASKTITVSFDQAATITADAALDFTVFALPIDITDVTLKFNFTDNTSKTLALKRNDVFDTFTAGKKYIITNAKVPGNDEWTYTLVEVDAEGNVIPVANIIKKGPAATDTLKRFKSYRTKVSDPTVQELVDVVIEYADTTETGGNSGIYTSTTPAWLAYNVDADGKPASTDPTGIWNSTAQLTVVPLNQPIITMDEIPEHKAIIGARLSNGKSVDDPQDLSLYEINALTGSPRAGNKPKTANCYVVDRKGWYQFPIVYGNAIDWDVNGVSGWNSTSYQTGLGTGWDSEHGYYLKTFQNYVAGPIKTPYILDDVNLTADSVEAVIVWEDVEESGQFIPASSVNVVETPTTDAVYYNVTGDATVTVPYITFQVNDEIRQGNAVIALREKTGNKRIIWSWHIWITELSMETQQINTHPSVNPVVASNDVLQYDLGWCDTRIERYYTYDKRKCYVRISHNDSQSNADPLIFEVTEESDPYWTLVLSSPTYYQQGRKDPFLPGTSNELTYEQYIGTVASPYTYRFINKVSHSPAGYTITLNEANVMAETTTTAMGNLDYSIQHPNVFYRRPSGDGYIGWLSKRRPWNLWNVHDTQLSMHPGWSDGGGLSEYSVRPGCDIIVVKSVYDPCPPGFSLPNYTAFTGVTDKGYNVAIKDGSGTHASDANWIPADAEHDPDRISGDHRYYIQSQDGIIVFPSSGCRDGETGAMGHMYNMFVGTAKNKGDRYYNCLSSWGPLGSANDRCTAYPIRPVRIHYDSAGNHSVVIGGQGTDGYYNPGDLNNNWQ